MQADYIGMEYADKGRTPQGVDCWGLVCLFYKGEYGITLPEYTGRYASANEIKEASALIRDERGTWDEVAQGHEHEGDVIILIIKGQPTHVGVVLRGKKMLHVLKGHNAVIERYDSPLWLRRLSGFIRHTERQEK